MVSAAPAHLVWSEAEIRLKCIEAKAFVAHIHKHIISPIECTVWHFTTHEVDLKTDSQVLQNLPGKRACLSAALLKQPVLGS
jgi:hypothetical protein